MIEENIDRESIIKIIDEGYKTEYWKLIKKVLEEWLLEENRILDSYKRYGIEGEKDIKKYNRSIDRIKYLNKFLTINETIIDYNRTILDRIKNFVVEKVSSSYSFMEELKDAAYK